MARSVEVPTKMIRGFKAHVADTEFFEEVAEGTAEKFGRDSRAYATVMNRINVQNGIGSQFFFNTQAGLYLPEGQRVATLADIGSISGSAPEFFDGSFYTDTPELVLRTATPSWENNAKILENLVTQARERGLEFSGENPLVLSGLEIVRDDGKSNPYGILLKIGESTQTRNDARFAYGNNSIKLGDVTRTLWTKQDGLSRVYLDRDGDVDSGGDYLSGSGDDGRVVVIDAEGVALEDFVAQELRPTQEKIAAIERILKR